MLFYGRNIVLEALRSDLFSSSIVYIQSDSPQSKKIELILDGAKKKSISVKELMRSEITKMTGSDEHQGVAIEVSYNSPKLNAERLSGNGNAFIYISEATFEHNVGAVIRSAEVAGFSGVIVPKELAISPTVAKTSAGAVFHIPVYKASIFNALKLFKDEGYLIAGIERDGSPHFGSDLTGNILLVIGGEDKSLSESVRDKCELILEIPQSGKINSLNMSVAAAIVMFERIRQASINT